MPRTILRILALSILSLSSGCSPEQPLNTISPTDSDFSNAQVAPSREDGLFDTVAKQLQLDAEDQASLKALMCRDPFAPSPTPIETTELLSQAMAMLAEKGQPICQVLMAKDSFRQLELTKYTLLDSGEMHVEPFFSTEIAEQLAKTLQVATSYMNAAEKSGERCAKHLMARYLIEENWTRGTREQGKGLLLQNAQANYIPSLLSLGEFHLEGKCLPKDFKRPNETILRRSVNCQVLQA